MVDVHADDYGYSHNTSLDIVECIRKNKLSSISIMPNMPSFEEDMQMLYDVIPSLSFLPKISIHINLVEGNSYEDGKTMQYSWYKLFLYSFMPNRGNVKDDIKLEIKRQIDIGSVSIEKCLEKAKRNNIPFAQKGIRIDSHVHTHPIPIVWEALMETIEENDLNVEYIRNPKEPLFPFIKTRRYLGTYKVINLIKNRILMTMSKKIDGYCEKNNLQKMHMYGLMMSGEMDYERISALLPEMKKYAAENERMLELLFHPGMALEVEGCMQMNQKSSRQFNMSENRHVEKNTVIGLMEVENDRKEK